MTVKKDEKEHYLPSREVAYAYTVAMHFAQRFEQNLRAVLYTADYHGWGEPIELNALQKKRFKDTDEFIDKGTCGLILEKLKKSGLVKGQGAADAYKTFDRACHHRNKLAHSYLADQNFDEITKQAESNIIGELQSMALDLYSAMRMARYLRERAEYFADQHHKVDQKIWNELTTESSKYENPNRHYATRKRKK